MENVLVIGGAVLENWDNIVAGALAAIGGFSVMALAFGKIAEKTANKTDDKIAAAINKFCTVATGILNALALNWGKK